MWHKSGIKGIFGVMVVVFFLIVGFGYVQAAEKVELHVLGLHDLTGPLSAYQQLFLKGARDAVAFVNETEYIPGVKLVYDVYDHGNDVSKAVLAFQMGIGKKPRPVVSTAGLASPIAMAIKPLAERNRIPCIDGTSARPIHIPPGWIFTYFCQNEGNLGAMANWLKTNWRQDSEVEWIRKHYQNRPPRISVLSWDNAFGRSFDQPEARAYLKKIGVEFVQPEYIPMAPTDTSAQLLRFKQAGVDLITVPLFASAYPVVLKDAERLGIRNDFMWVLAWMAQVYDGIRLAGPLADDLMILTGNNLLVEEWPKHIRESFHKSGLGPKDTEGYANALGWFDICSEAIRRAIKAVGSPEKVDGEAVYQALITFKDFRPMCQSANNSFLKTKTVGPDTADIYQVKNGKVVRISKNWPIPDLFPRGKDVPK